MPHGYCNDCQARVTVIDGRCLLGHRVDQTTLSSRRGRRISSSTTGSLALGSHESGHTTATAVLDRPEAPAPEVRGPHGRRERVQAEGATVVADRPPAPRPSVTRRVEHQPTPTPPKAAKPLDDLNPTGEMVFDLWSADDGTPALEDWQPDDVMSGMPERRTATVISAFLVILAVLSIVVAMSFVLRSGDPAAASVSSGAVSLGEAIDAFDPSAPQPAFSAIDGPARVLLESAQTLEVGDPDRAVAIEASGTVLDAERALSDALAYEAGFVVYVGRPALPTAASDLSETTELFTSWLSSFTNVASPVPSQSAFADHARLVDEFLDSMPGVQSQYFDALRSGDSGTAAAALAALDNSVATLETSVHNAVIQSQVDTGASLATAREMLSRIDVES